MQDWEACLRPKDAALALPWEPRPTTATAPSSPSSSRAGQVGIVALCRHQVSFKMQSQPGVLGCVCSFDKQQAPLKQQSWPGWCPCLLTSRRTTKTPAHQCSSMASSCKAEVVDATCFSNSQPLLQGSRRIGLHNQVCKGGRALAVLRRALLLPHWCGSHGR